MNDGTQFRLYSQGQKGTDMYTSVRANKTFDAQLYPRDDLETASLLISEIVSHESMPWARDLTILFVLQTKLKTPLSVCVQGEIFVVNLLYLINNPFADTLSKLFAGARVLCRIRTKIATIRKN